MAFPIVAQEEAPGPGLGGQIIVSNIGDDPPSFNPITGNDTASSAVYNWMYPEIIGIDPVTFNIAPNVDQALAAGWEYDETGTVLTIQLRQDAFWADGEQITAEDYLWAFTAVQSGTTSSPRTYVMYQTADGTVTEGPVHEIMALDDFTIQVRLGLPITDDSGELVLGDDGKPVLTVSCDAIQDLNDIPVVPAHVFEAAYGSDFASMDGDPYFVPKTDGGLATFGAFTDPYMEPGVQISLLASADYPDANLGFVSPSEWLYQNVESTTVSFERFLAGDFTYESVSADNQNSMRGDERFQIVEYPGNSYTYMGYNLADPNNPQAGRDAEGNLIDQGIHPVFGDVRVRQAIAYAVNVREIIGTAPDGDTPATGILEGNGYPIGTNTAPSSSTNDELEAMGVAPYEFDPAKADELLTEAGWVDTDGNGVRECQGCLYATSVDASFEGTELQFELLTNAGNSIRESIGETIRAQLSDAGFIVNYQAIEFGTLVDELLGQQFDALIIGWSLGAPFLPGGTLNSFFTIANDRPGAGFNYVSFNDPDFDDLVKLGDGLPAAEDGSYAACDPDKRDELYAEAQRILWEQQPYLWLYIPNVMVAAQANVEGWDPLPNAAAWNLDA